MSKENITLPGSVYTGPESPAEQVSQREARARILARAYALQIIENGHIEYDSWLKYSLNMLPSKSI
jgi:hypothetical protein